MSARVARYARLAAMLVALAAALQAPPARAQGIGLMDSATRVRVSAVAGAEAVAPGGRVPVAVVFDIDPGWKIQTNDPVVPPELGDASLYIKTEIKVGADAPSSLKPSPGLIQWPPVHMTQVAFLGQPVEFGVFNEQAVAFLPVAVAPDAPEGSAGLPLLVTYQACDATICLAPVFDQPVVATVRVASGAPASPSPAAAPLFAAFDAAVWARLPAGPTAASASSPARFDLFEWRFDLDPTTAAGLGLLFAVAALGGLLLNFTPCCLPLIPLKMMSLSQAAGDRRRMLRLGAVMSLGVVAFWLVLGGLVATVAGFTSANQLFQVPAFTLGVGVVIAVMAIGMTGRFSVQLPQAVYRLNPGRETYPGAFGFGVLVAVLSTPCTGPFMGAAAWAATQRPALTLATFASIGVGMAVPYLALSAAPDLVRRLPRSGPASQLVKEVMGLFLLAAAAYFVGVGLSGLAVRPPDPPSRAYWWAVAFFVAAAGAWLGYRARAIAASPGRRGAFGAIGLALVVAALAGAATFTEQGPIDWTFYTPERQAEALASGKVVVLEFTAEWCLNCKALEEGVLKTDRIAALLDQPDVVPMRVDLTGKNEAGNRALRAVDRVSLPLIVVFAADGTEVFKTDYYTADQLVGAVERARAISVASGRASGMDSAGGGGQP